MLQLEIPQWLSLTANGNVAILAAVAIVSLLVRFRLRR